MSKVHDILHDVAMYIIERAKPEDVTFKLEKNSNQSH